MEALGLFFILISGTRCGSNWTPEGPFYYFDIFQSDWCFVFFLISSAIAFHFVM